MMWIPTEKKLVSATSFICEDLIKVPTMSRHWFTMVWLCRILFFGPVISPGFPSVKIKILVLSWQPYFEVHFPPAEAVVYQPTYFVICDAPGVWKVLLFLRRENQIEWWFPLPWGIDSGKLNVTYWFRVWKLTIIENYTQPSRVIS